MLVAALQLGAVPADWQAKVDAARALKSHQREGREEMAQHQGLGARLLREAEERASRAGYSRLAIIAAVGTRGYYARHGYRRAEGETYMIKRLDLIR